MYLIKVQSPLFQAPIKMRKPPLSSHFQSDMESNSKDKTYVCHICDKVFYKKFNLKRHLLTHEDLNSTNLECSKCHRKFNRKDNKDRHEATCTGIHQCRYCKKAFKLQKTLDLHKCKLMKEALKKAAKKPAQNKVEEKPEEEPVSF